MGKAVPQQLCGTWKCLTDIYISKTLLKLVYASAESAEAKT